ncbi:hypothetical protein C666_06275 [Thauera linaloolentis 47Lol = DSM 12138]|uniref:Uncharacterized protein n=2 Tax=Thauera linaloolentis TaxID=76112 RepID=N6Y5D1_THAL4|nr:hypothetical protein C666_06275 [Thauera linaloolentis 47Lol = DSM 12138]
MDRRNLTPLAVAVAGFGLFAAIWAARPPVSSAPPAEVFDRVVLSAPVQVLLTGGDRFLAANFESIRAVATASDAPEAAEANASFAIRARRVVAQLNPCHEDNYYQGNALLTWGGAVAEGNDLLRRATDCRFWDEVPPFFYGFNQYFFLHDADGARTALETAAERATDNAAGFRKFAIMLAAGELKDDSAALEFLQRERAQTNDPKLQGMLDKRIARLQGLIALRMAQQRYEARFGHALTNPQALIDSGELDAFPDDPLRIGYEFADGRFRLRELKIAGLERP